MKKLLSLKNNSFYYCFSLIIFRLLLDYAFSICIAKEYAYLGFHNSLTIFSGIVSWAILFCFIWLNVKCFNNSAATISHEIAYLFFLFSIIPFSSMVAFNNVTITFVLLNCVYWFIFFIIIRSEYMPFKFGHIKLSYAHINWDVTIKLITLFLSATVIYISAKYTHFRINLNLSKVYELRAEAGSYNLTGLLVYVHSWSRNLNAILLAYYIRKKNLIWAIYCLFIQILNFGIDGSKTTLFLVICVLFVNLMPPVDFQKMNQLFTYGFTGLAGLSVISYTLFDNIWLCSLFIRRMLYVPVQLAVNYVDFFTTNTPDYFRQSVLRRLGVNSPYPRIPYMIGNVYFHQSIGANNGLISDAITNLGIVGVVLFPLLLAYTLKIMDLSSRGLDSRLYLVISIYISFTLINSFLFTTLLTHGLIATIVLLSIIKRDNTIYSKSSRVVMHRFFQ